VARQLVAKCEGYGDPLAQPWQSKLCAYASAATGVHAALEELLQSPALTPASDAEAAAAFEALQAVRKSAGQETLTRPDPDGARFSPKGLKAVFSVCCSIHF
jgi:hypothetical protein